MEILLDYFYIEFYELFEGWILSTFILEGQGKKKKNFLFVRPLNKVQFESMNEITV